MNNDWAFVPMRDSSQLLGDSAALHRRMEQDGYLYLPKLLDRELLLQLRKKILEVLAQHGWIAGGEWLLDAVPVGPPLDEGHKDFADAYDAVQRIEEFHVLAHDPRLLAVMRQVVGPTAFPHPLKIARLVFPANYEMTTPPHQDYPNNQGTPRLTASWIPLSDCPKLLGPLAVLRGSHRFGVLPLEPHPGPGNRQARIPRDLLETLRWVTTDFAAGDVLLFTACTVHAALHNASEVHLRLSVDFRYQEEGQELTAPCLAPHFGRQSWEQVYAGWTSARWQYYWKTLDYRVVPFRELPMHGAHPLPADAVGTAASVGEAFRAAVASGAVELTPAQWRELLHADSRRQERSRRRIERVRALLAERETGGLAAKDGA
ncbi:MAG TPA: phytanoyl-CoA dioxygenase family protein [Myxococcota bacterium]|nr:phytanoyl-CoA dioxygenase family protein [Myxococcota bacterium]